MAASRPALRAAARHGGLSQGGSGFSAGSLGAATARRGGAGLDAAVVRQPTGIATGAVGRSWAKWVTARWSRSPRLAIRGASKASPRPAPDLRRPGASWRRPPRSRLRYTARGLRNPMRRAKKVEQLAADYGAAKSPRRPQAGYVHAVDHPRQKNGAANATPSSERECCRISSRREISGRTRQCHRSPSETRPGP